jgi:hypothetical protein
LPATVPRFLSIRVGRADPGPTTGQEIDVAENPFMSAYLTAANRAVNTARGKATVEAKRAASRQRTSAVNAWVDAMTGGAARPKRRRKRR